MKQKDLSLITMTVREHISVLQSFFSENSTSLAVLCDEIASSLKKGGKILIFGNGGSAADAQHIAAELVNRLSMKRRAIPAIALTTDSSILTSIANDLSFDEVFSRQIEALGNRGDIALGISTSGRSGNVLKGLAKARRMGLKTVALLGHDGGPAKKSASISLTVRSRDTQRIQEIHCVIGHLICMMIEDRLFRKSTQGE